MTARGAIEPCPRMLGRTALCSLVIAWAAIVLVRLAGPSDLMDNDQLRPGMYALDVLRHGRWIVQTDPTGDVASKPPLYIWGVAAVAMATGRVDEWALYAPTAGAMLAVTLLAARAGASAFGRTAGWLAGAAFLLSPYAAKHVALARTDAVFAAFVTASALLAYRAWTSGSAPRWILFWVLAAAATLTKGPLGLLLAGAGLIAMFVERSDATSTPNLGPRSTVARAHGVGAALFLALTLGWLAAAYAQLGQPVLDKLIGRELLGHAAVSDSGGAPFTGFYKPPLYFLSRFAPWSVPAFVGMWRAIAQPAANDDERRFERFLLGWFLVGLGVFCAAPHQRADLLLPIVPAGAIFAGRELARQGGVWLARRTPIAFAFCAMAAIAMVGVQWFALKPGDPMVRRTMAVRDLADRISRTPGLPEALVDVDAPFALQFFLQVHRRREPADRVAELLAGPDRVIVARGGMHDPSIGGRTLAILEDPARQGEPLIVLLTNDDECSLAD